ncbi:hypothetical protein [uncultured Oscillibacter sp.]|uniref:hypothetical protein n=1 Tax=uncultured Oscillibacter sp. TaxID=876091 RepID=UPI0025E90B10|nr:hypothetical protein [uncultured Oscillibacter sp.]
MRESTQSLLEALFLDYLSVMEKADPELRTLNEQSSALQAAFRREFRETPLLLRLNDLLDLQATIAARRETLLFSAGLHLGLELGGLDPLEPFFAAKGNFFRPSSV